MSETLQAENVLAIGTRVKITEKGRDVAHYRLHDCVGTVLSSSSNCAAVRWDAVHMNSGSKENTRENGPHVPRIRQATSVIPIEHLEVAECRQSRLQ